MDMSSLETREKQKWVRSECRGPRGSGSAAGPRPCRPQPGEAVLLPGKTGAAAVSSSLLGLLGWVFLGRVDGVLCSERFSNQVQIGNSHGQRHWPLPSGDPGTHGGHVGFQQMAESLPTPGLRFYCIVPSK